MGALSSLLLAGLALNADTSAVVRPGLLPPPGETVLFSLPVGEAVSYAGEGPEQSTWGPAGIAVSDDGTIWIADGADHRVIGFDRSGEVVQETDLGPWVVGIGGIAAFGEVLVVLDIAAVEPSIVVVDRATGTVAATVTLPAEANADRALSGVAVMADATIVAELRGGVRLVPVARIDPSSAGLTAVEDGSVIHTYRTPAGPVRLLGGASALIGGTRVALSTEGIGGTVRFVGATAEVVYLTVDEMSQCADGTVLADTTVRAYDVAGAELGAARIPLAELAVRPSQPVALAPDGEIVALLPREETIDVVSLGLSDELPTVLPPLGTLRCQRGAPASPTPGSTALDVLADDPRLDTLADGEHFGFVSAFTGDVIVFDPAEVFGNEEADAAAAEDGQLPPGGLPNPFYVRNPETTTLRLPVAEGFDASLYDNVEIRPRPVDAATLAGIYAGEADRSWVYANPDVWPVLLVVDAGQVVRADEVYLP